MAQNTIEILSSINRLVTQIAINTAPQNKTSENILKRINQSNTVDTKESNTKGIDISSASIAKISNDLLQLPSAVRSIAGLSGKTMANFTDVVESLVTTVMKLSDVAETITEDKQKSIRNVVVIINNVGDMMKVASKSLLISPFALLGVTMAIPVMLAIGGLLKVIEFVSIATKMSHESLSEINKGINAIIGTLIKASVLVVVCMGLGLLITTNDTKKLIMSGLIGLGAIILTTISVMGLTTLFSKIVNQESANKSMRDIMMFIGSCAILTIVMVSFGKYILSDDVSGSIKGGLVAMGGLLIGILAMGLATFVVSKIACGEKNYKAIGSIIGFTVASMLIVVASKHLGDFVFENYEPILAGIGSVSVILVGLWGISKLANKIGPNALKGVISMGLIFGLAFLSIKMLRMCNDLSNELKGRGGDIALTILGIVGVITAFGALATAASLIALPIIAGSIALLSIVPFVSSSIKLVHKIIDLHNIKNENDIDWKDINDNVSGLSKVILKFGGLASVMGIALVPVTLGSVAILPISGFVSKCVGMISSIVDLMSKIEDSGGINKISNFLGSDITKITGSIKKDIFDIPISLIDIASLNLKYGIIGGFVNGFVDVATKLCEVTKIVGMVDDRGRISPFLGYDDKNNPIYGTPVDISKVSSSIMESIKTFVNGMDYDMTDIQKIYMSGRAIRIIDGITTPINAFISMLTGYQSGSNGSLVPVYIDESGKVYRGAECNVSEVAKIIVGAIDTFLKEIYKEENVSNWSNYIYGDRTTFQKLFGLKNTQSKSVNAVAGILGGIVEPINGVINLLTSFVSDEKDGICTVHIENGEIKKGPSVNTSKVATAITNAITTFVDTLFKKENINKWKGVSGEDTLSIFDDVNNIIGTFNKIGDIDVVKIDSNIKSINKSLSSMYDNNFSQANDRVKELYTSADILSNKLNRLDNTLIDESGKRKRAIDDFKNSITELLEKFSNAGESVHELYVLVKYLENMDSGKISNNVSSIRTNMNTVSNNQYDGQGNINNVTIQQNQLNIEDFASAFTSAIRNALDGATLKRRGTLDIDPTSQFSDIVNILQGGYEIDIM